MARIVLVLAFLLPSILWISVVGDPLSYHDDGAPAGQVMYVLSKLAGLYAAALFAVNLGLMVFRKSKQASFKFEWSAKNHQRLGVLVTLLVALHIGLFIAATTIRSGHLTTHLLIPRMGTGYYDAMVSIGAIAMYLLIVVIVVGATMRRSCNRASKLRFHFGLVMILTPLVIVHSYAIGSETNDLLFILFYLILAFLWLKGIGLLARR